MKEKKANTGSLISIAVAILIVTTVFIAQASTVTVNSKDLDKDFSQSLEANVPEGFSIATAGDMMLTHPVPHSSNPGFVGLLNGIKNAEVAFTNFESSLIDMRHFSGFAQAISDSLRPLSSPGVAADLKNMGFDMVSLAGNHSADYGPEGMLETRQRLDQVGIVHAGTGKNLSSAGATRYLDSTPGRIGLIAITTTFDDVAKAMDSLGEAPGRPGVNGLKLRREVHVDSKTMSALHGLKASLPEGSTQPDSMDDTLMLLGVTYREGKKFGFDYKMDQKDLARILKSVHQGKLNSDFLVVSIHSHEPGSWSEEPANFLPELARSLVDSGADIVVGHGPHILRGIEIYQGKPIFYSLGNFIFQISSQGPLAYDIYRKLRGEPEDFTDAELLQKRIGPYVEKDIWYESVIAVTKFSDGSFSEIELYPLELNLDKPMVNRGIPQPASEEVAKKILNRLVRLSENFGTEVEIQGTKGIIRNR